MGIPLREVYFNGGKSIGIENTFVHWDNILYRPEMFSPSPHNHPEIISEIEVEIKNLVQVVETVPTETHKGQLFFVRK